jgi:membrane protein
MMVQGAALAYYTFIAIVPLIIVALNIAGICFGQDSANKELFNEINGLVGEQGGKAIHEIVIAAARPHTAGIAALVSGVALVFGAAGVFVQLQNSLNLVWQVRLKSGHSLRGLIRHRFLSFAMVLGVGFLFLVSLLLNAILSSLGGFLGSFLSEQAITVRVMNASFSTAVITTLFACILKFLPDVRIAWRNVWLGGFFTAMLFNIGKVLFGLYISHSTVASIYGTMGSLVILLLWVYFSAQILFFGACLTSVLASHSHRRPYPIPGVEAIDHSLSRAKF